MHLIHALTLTTIFIYGDLNNTRQRGGVESATYYKSRGEMYEEGEESFSESWTDYS
jgi:hypothetical protein